MGKTKVVIKEVGFKFSPSVYDKANVGLSAGYNVKLTESMYVYDAVFMNIDADTVSVGSKINYGEKYYIVESVETLHIVGDELEQDVKKVINVRPEKDNLENKETTISYSSLIEFEKELKKQLEDKQYEYLIAKEKIRELDCKLGAYKNKHKKLKKLLFFWKR
jgi:hypothetical protein